MASMPRPPRPFSVRSAIAAVVAAAAYLPRAKSLDVVDFALLTRILGPSAPADGSSATSALLTSISGIASSSADSAVYLSTSTDGPAAAPIHVVYAIDKVDHSIFTFAGGVSHVCDADLGDGGFATTACLASPAGLAVGTIPSTLYIADANHAAVRFVGVGNRITRAAGSGALCVEWDMQYEGGLATRACLGRPSSVAVQPVSSDLVVADRVQNGV